MMITHVTPDAVVSYFNMSISDLEFAITTAKVEVADALMNNELGSNSIIDNKQWEIYYMKVAIKYRINNNLD